MINFMLMEFGNGPKDRYIFTQGCITWLESDFKLWNWFEPNRSKEEVDKYDICYLQI